MPKPKPISASAVVYVDNSFADFFAQIDYLFSSGFLPKDTEIIAKYRHVNFRSITEGAGRYGAKVHFYTKLARMPDIAPGAVVIYPYNAQTNARLMLNRRCAHVFVGHGDSNKKASCNPLVRAYDHVLVAGELSRQRLVDQGILRPSQTRDHSICIGTSVIDERHAALYRYGPSGSDASLGYFPTWEGGFEAENYSSLAEPATASLLRALTRKLSVSSVLIDPHPNLGQRQPRYGKALRAVVEKLMSSGIQVEVRWKENKTHALKPLQDFIAKGAIRLREDQAALRYAAVDVSAAEGIITSRGIPSAVFWRDQAALYPAASYGDLRQSALVPLSSSGRVDLFVSEAGTDADLKRQEAFADMLFSYDDVQFRNLDNAGRWKALREQFFFPGRSND